MYTQYLEVRDSKIGKGVFAKIKIPANSPLIEVTGDIYTIESLKSKNLYDHPAIYQVGHNSYIGPSGKQDDYINHSCDPNCRIHILGNRAIVYSLYEIPKDSEITFDYSTSSTDNLDDWKIECQCESIKCRKIVSGLQYLDSNLIEEYKNKKMIPLFLSNLNFRKPIE